LVSDEVMLMPRGEKSFQLRGLGLEIGGGERPIVGMSRSRDDRKQQKCRMSNDEGMTKPESPNE